MTPIGQGYGPEFKSPRAHHLRVVAYSDSEHGLLIQVYSYKTYCIAVLDEESWKEINLIADNSSMW